MGSFHSKTRAASRGVTLNTLKEQLYSLNMRMLLAMQTHDREAQEEIKGLIAEVQAEIDCMNLGKTSGLQISHLRAGR
ncbi:MAG: hypothetical protein HFE84_00665 [Lachnospiraceae bacterium]|nr:hypothetical protein [Lachnospiraceae bacterium]